LLESEGQKKINAKKPIVMPITKGFKEQNGEPSTNPRNQNKLCFLLHAAGVGKTAGQLLRIADTARRSGECADQQNNRNRIA